MGPPLGRLLAAHIVLWALHSNTLAVALSRSFLGRQRLVN